MLRTVSPLRVAPPSRRQAQAGSRDSRQDAGATRFRSQRLYIYPATSAVQTFDSSRSKTLAAYPTANVTHVPIATHQVKATCDHPHKYSSIANPQIMPTIVPL